MSLLRAAAARPASASSKTVNLLSNSLRQTSHLPLPQWQAVCICSRPLSNSSTRPAPRKPLLDEYGLPRKPTPLPKLNRTGKPVLEATSDETRSAARPTSEPTPLPPPPSSNPPTPPPPRLKRATKRSPKLVKLTELSSETELTEDGRPLEEQTALEKTIRRDLARYPTALLLTQVGSFFESYFDQAPLVAKLLGIKLTSKSWGKGANKTRAPFAGFPIGQLQKHLSTLVEAGWKVVVVEEVPDEGAATVRQVTRIVTPGTGIDDGFVKEDSMNFVLAVGVSGDAGPPASSVITLAYRDISTGASFARDSNLARLRDDLLLVQPREIVVDANLGETEVGKKVQELLELEAARESWMISPTTTASPDANDILTTYLASMLLATPPPATPTKFVDPEKVLQMDSTTLQSLEIRASLRGGVRGTLASAVRRTVTPGGHRLLLERLCAPSTEIAEITARHDLVSAFQALPDLRLYLLSLLKSLEDTSRLLQRLSMKRGSAFDLIGLKKTILAVEEVRSSLLDHREEIEQRGWGGALKALLERLQSHAGLAREIEEAIDEEALMVRFQASEKRAGLSMSLGVTGAEKELSEEEDEWKRTPGLWGDNQEWVIKSDFSPALRSNHADLTALRRQADELEASLRTQYRLPSLTLKTVMKQGPVLHIQTKSSPGLIDDDPLVVPLTRTGSTRTYVLASWSALHIAIEKKTALLRDLESQTVKALVAQVVRRFNALQQTSESVSELDVALGFAQVAQDLGWVRPTINDGTSLKIVDGRHPTVEQALLQQGRAFSSNSVEFSHPSAFVHCLTGPNMAGKSTFLRQTALIVILAQTGSFVPASSVDLGIVDRVFSRVGARDELDRDRSTFMIEMDEAAGILHTATNRSLVLFDELGRGTSPLDGLAIAYASLEHLVNVNRSRTLFATHYHRLGHLIGYEGGEADEKVNPLARGEGKWEGVEFWCTDLEEKEGMVTYSHTIRRGLNDDSAGLVIARLAGLPDRTVKLAHKVREQYR